VQFQRRDGGPFPESSRRGRLEILGQVLDIAIAGAGPAGLATALYLDRFGHRVTLFERFEQPKPIGSGLILQPTGLAVLDDLGLHGEIAALGQPLDALRGTDAKSGRVVLDVKYAALRRLGRGLGIHRAALFNVLHNAVARTGFAIVHGHTVTGVEQRLSGFDVLFGDRREGPFDLVVDAMGANSPLKELASSRDTTRPLAYGALWACVPWVDTGFDRRALTQRYEKAKVMIGVLPIGRQTRQGPDLAAFFWSLKTDQYVPLVAEGLPAFKERVAKLWPETAPHLEAIRSFDDLTLAKYAHHTLRTPAGEGIAFVGDSAHATSPQLGQGANMALLDARALYLSLRDMASLLEALARYAARRRWHVRLYQALSVSLTPFYQSDSEALPAFRDFFVAGLARVPPAPQFLAAMVAGSLLSPLRGLELKRPPVLEDRVDQRGMSGQT
jgi:2-polyprenyl-6-methoxyphenol hydroxylase-like FAD-dependent oxidoreductase